MQHFWRIQLFLELYITPCLALMPYRRQLGMSRNKAHFEPLLRAELEGKIPLV